MLHLTSELLSSNLTKSLPKYSQGKLYLYILKKYKSDNRNHPRITIYTNQCQCTVILQKCIFLPSQHSQVFTRLKSLISSEIDFVVNQNYNKISERD